MSTEACFALHGTQENDNNNIPAAVMYADWM